MDNSSGVTRDRHYGYAEWNGKSFTVIDTGGYVEGSDDSFEVAIRTQVKEALSEAIAQEYARTLIERYPDSPQASQVRP